ncbi:MAG: DUF971 domain-containing protein [Calditrichaceae bacterium]|nr:DUF971 domain-containing protein [Calditrichaceae bacterium]MBN2708906.1 DUF971 domain-containing protein [Calditrichaceae bacterium]RQV97570.1 MAG: DUF971 domain-containing protein [Calditrichota bacterium]
MFPETINQISENTLMIVWDDGHESLYFADHLRKNCPCAVCQEKKDNPPPASRFKLWKPPQSGNELKITDWSMVGRYALSFEFSDGHSSGIYPFSLLRSLCQCDLCTGNSIRIEGAHNR